MVDGDEPEGVFSGPVGDLGVLVAGGFGLITCTVALGEPPGAVGRGVDGAAGFGPHTLTNDDLAAVEGVPWVLASLHEQGGDRLAGVGTGALRLSECVNCSAESSRVDQ